MPPVSRDGSTDAVDEEFGPDQVRRIAMSLFHPVDMAIGSGCGRSLWRTIDYDTAGATFFIIIIRHHSALAYRRREG